MTEERINEKALMFEDAVKIRGALGKDFSNVLAALDAAHKNLYLDDELDGVEKGVIYRASSDLLIQGILWESETPIKDAFAETMKAWKTL